MSNNGCDAQTASFIEALRTCSASRVLELGTLDESFARAVIEGVNWVGSAEIHCSDPGSQEFDSVLVSSASKSDVQFGLTKHVGSETEIHDAVIRVAEESPFDAVFVSSAASNEGALTACMVAHETLRSGGVLGVSHSLLDDAPTSEAVSSFIDMFGDIYQELEQFIFIKN